MYCLCYCFFYTSCAVINIACTGLNAPNILNDAVIQYLKLPNVNCLCLLPGQRELWREKRMRHGTAKTSVSIP